MKLVPRHSHQRLAPGGVEPRAPGAVRGRVLRTRCAASGDARWSGLLSLGFVILLLTIAGVACRSDGIVDSGQRIEVADSIGLRPDALTRTVAVLTTWHDRDKPRRVDVYRVVNGALPNVWPLESPHSLSSSDLQMIRTCEAQRLSSWDVADGTRIEGLWTVGVDGSVLSHEYRRFDRGVGWEGASLAMRDGSGRKLWELSPSEIFPPEERGDFEVRSHGYDWIVSVAILPNTDSVCIFARGEHIRTIGIRDGRPGKNIVDRYSYAR